MIHNGWTYDGHIEWNRKVFQIWHKDFEVGSNLAYRGYIETHQPSDGSANPPPKNSGHSTSLKAFSRMSRFPLELLESVVEETTQREA
jgi:hypothetical protein